MPEKIIVENNGTNVGKKSNSSPIVKLSGVLCETDDNSDEIQLNENMDKLFKIDVQIFYCKLCCVILNEEKNVKNHVSTNFHKTKLNNNVSSFNEKQTCTASHLDLKNKIKSSH